MSYIPSEEALSQYENAEPSQPSLGAKYKDYMQGLGSQLLQSGAMGGYHVANAPSYAYEAITGHPLYNLIKPDVAGFSPHSEAGQTGQHVGEMVGDLSSLMLPGSVLSRGMRALSRYHPFTKGQMGRQIQGPINAAEHAGIRYELPNNDLYELNDLLSHPALEIRGAAGRGLTPVGRQSVIQGAAEGRFPALHSAQSLLGDLERVIPGLGESQLASSRVRPLKDKILQGMQRQLREGGLPEEAEMFQQAREAARRYYQTRKVASRVGKKLSLAALIKAGLSGAKGLP